MSIDKEEIRAEFIRRGKELITSMGHNGSSMDDMVLRGTLGPYFAERCMDAFRAIIREKIKVDNKEVNQELLQLAKDVIDELLIMFLKGNQK
jgi:hypothetical protein